MIRMKDISEYLHSQPFVPFRIHTSDGASHEVTHPELARVSPNYVMIFMPISDKSFLEIEDSKRISMLHISWLEPVGTGSKRKKSG